MSPASLQPIADRIAVTTPAVRLEDLAPVSLDELIAHAPRQTRVDRKYLVPRSLLPRLYAGLPGDTRVLDIDALRQFAYHSTYFDTAELACYHLAGQRRRRRAKVRVRSYLDTGSSWVEVKTRGPRGTTIKHRVTHEVAREDQLGAAGAVFVADRLDEALVAGVPVADLVPVLTTGYTRSTLLLGADRVTVDTDLRWALPASAGRGLHLPELAIVETKSGAAPTAVDHALWRLGHRPLRMSKFGAGLAALQPGLHPLKWRRAVTAYLTPSTHRSPGDPATPSEGAHR